MYQIMFVYLYFLNLALKTISIVKSVEERNIPWSQQVDEASYENLSSPAIDDNSGSVKLFNLSTNDSINLNNFLAGTQSSMQFQFPPFYIKENNNSSSNITGKGRKTSHNNGMYMINIVTNFHKNRCKS